MIPIWMLSAQGVKKVADNQNNQIETFDKNQHYTPNGQPMNVDVNGNSGGELSNALSTFSSIYSNYLNGYNDKKKLFMR